MLIIANNITSRNPRVATILRQQISGSKNAETEACPGLRDIVEACLSAGADVLEVNLQQHYDHPETMEFAIGTIQEITDCQLCLSSNKAEALESGLRKCKRPPIINYVGIDTQRLKEILPLAAQYRADLILLISDPAMPGDARQMLEKAAILVGAANGAGIPDERLILDPGIFHITKEQGQHHLVEVKEVLRAIPETFDPQIRTTCWLNNSSAGAPARLRPIIETSLLSLLSGLGLSSIFMDVLRRENQRAIRLMKIFNNEKIYADGDLSL
jgi:5-methyltetrahydrofolate corrinoid/iron sulfur protein methyltransferase